MFLVKPMDAWNDYGDHSIVNDDGYNDNTSDDNNERKNEHHDDDLHHELVLYVQSRTCRILLCRIFFVCL